MILSDHDIDQLARTIFPTANLISPYKRSNLQPASVDLTLDNLFLVPSPPRYRGRPIDLADIKGTEGNVHQRITQDQFVLYPRSFVLASTAETVNIPPDIVGRVEGKSSLGRLGLFVHATAGFLDPGFRGKITLEMFNANPRPIKLRAGLRICQVSFSLMTSPAEKPYGHAELGSKYQDQSETTPSRFAG